jgi:hypothetical protein
MLSSAGELNLHEQLPVSNLPAILDGDVALPARTLSGAEPIHRRGDARAHSDYSYYVAEPITLTLHLRLGPTFATGHVRVFQREPRQGRKPEVDARSSACANLGRNGSAARRASTRCRAERRRLLERRGRSSSPLVAENARRDPRTEMSGTRALVHATFTV